MKLTSLKFAVLGTTLLLVVGCSRNNVHQSVDASIHQLDGNPKVLADYQPWFGDKQHISVGYSTQDPDTLRRQIQEAKSMGIHAFAVDWYGNRQPFLDRSYALLQQIAAENNFHVALMYDETEEDTGHATEDALQAFDKAYKSYIGPEAPGREAYLTYQGRPVIFVFPKRGNTNWDEVRQMVSQWEQPPILIMKDKPRPPYIKDFDGYYAWVSAGPVGWKSDGSNWGEAYLRNFYETMHEKYPGKIAVGGVWPGFNDSKASWSLNRHMDRRCGDTFEDTLRLFREYNDPNHPMPFIMLATWNDYEEGTQIENGISHCKGQNS
jgi:hypothetical protein